MLAIWFKNKAEAEECIRLYGSPYNKKNAESFYEGIDEHETLAFAFNRETNEFGGYCWQEWYEKEGYDTIPYSEWKQGKIKTEENTMKALANITEMERAEILSRMEVLLSEYNYTYTKKALNKIIDTWAVNKADMIAAFKKHPNYLEGKFMIAFDTNINRNIDVHDAKNFFDLYLDHVANWGKNDIPEDLKKQREIEGCRLLPYELYKLLLGNGINTVTTKTLSSEMAEKINEAAPWAHAHEGQKTTRVVNKICAYLGYNKHPEYNREFAKYADAMSPMQIKRHTVISINPLDYFTMSFGNSWASCHTIDKTNKRGMPNSYEGQYSSGTVSYMLDKTSTVFYTVDTSYEGNEYYTQPKINRQMFHWNRPCLVQGRLYPQDNNGCSEEYRIYREIAQKIFSELYDFPNFWHNTKGTDAASRYIHSEGTHYEDYTHYSNCNLSVIKGEEGNERVFTVGHAPICVECGNEHSDSNCINCCNKPGVLVCASCSDEINEDDARWINGNPYCDDCCSYCDCCEEYHTGGSTYINDTHEYVCSDCRDEHYEYCESCDEWYERENTRYVEDEGTFCDSCYNDIFCTCENCNRDVRIRYTSIRGGRNLCEECTDEYDEEESEE